MRSLLLVARREFRAYWSSPIAYAVLSIYLVLSGLFFFGELSQFVGMVQSSGAKGVDVNQQMIRPYFYSVSVMILFLLPMITMRLLAEERRQGTLEVRLTTPIPEWSLVLGKFAAAFALLGALLLGSVFHVGILFMVGDPDPGPVLTGFLGLLLTGAVYISLGIFFSSLTQNQVVAGAISFSLFLLLWLIGWAGGLVSGAGAEILGYISLAGHFDNFGRGVLDTSDLVFYLSWILAGLYAAIESVRSTRWKT